MSQTSCCPKCEATLSPDASLEGLCPQCLLAIAMTDSQIDTTGEISSRISGKPESGEQLLDRLIGQVLDGKYRLDRKLGQGGMGAVYLATHMGTGRPVAVKVIAPQFMSNEEFVERFKREARAAGLLRHPNVVNVTDFGFATTGSDSLAYLVMEYLDGCTLGAMLKRKGQLPLSFVIDVVEQICLAIDEAHRQGIIHRDLKPDNIWLEPDGRGGYNIKVLDFGLAKLRDVAPSDQTDIPALPAAGVGSETVSAVTAIQPLSRVLDASMLSRSISGVYDERGMSEEKTGFIKGEATAGNIDPQTVPNWLTRVGMVLGTPHYMSPEQCHGKQLDTSSDIYSLGIIVFEMLAGEPPFTGNMYQLIAKHTDMPPPPLREKRADIPGSVAAVVMSALAKDPSERPVTAVAFAAAFRANAEGEAPILRQAFDIYRQHFYTFACISLGIYLPFVALNILPFLSLSILSGVPSLLSQAIQKGYWLIAILLFLFANTLNKAICAPVVAQLKRAPSSTVQISTAFAALKKNLSALVVTAIYAGAAILLRLLKFVNPGVKAYTDYSLYAPVIVMEGKRGHAALERSRMLVDRLRSIAVPIQVRDIFIASAMLLLSLTAFVLCNTALDVLKTVRILKVFIVILIGSAPLLFIVLAHPLVAIASSLLYFKTLQAGAEALSEVPNSFTEQPEISTRRRFLLRRTEVLLGALLIMFAVMIIARERVLILAAESGATNTVRALLTVGIQVDAKDGNNSTALISAAKRGKTDVVTVLLAAGADRSTKDSNGQTAFTAGVKSGHGGVVKALLTDNIDLETKNMALLVAAEAGHTDVVDLLLAAGANIRSRNNDGQTVLMIAAKEGHANLVKALIAADAEVAAKDRNNLTALALATKRGQFDVLRILLGETESLGQKYYRFRHDKHMARPPINNRCEYCHDTDNTNAQNVFRNMFRMVDIGGPFIHKSSCFTCHDGNPNNGVSMCAKCHTKPPGSLSLE
jgi:serine/threonine protein kinase